MLLGDVMDELGTALGVIPDLRVFPYWADRIVPPAAVVAWPERITYDATYHRGGDRADIPVIVLAGRADARTSRDRMARYLDGTGAHSVKAAVDGHQATAYDSATVSQAAEVTSVLVANVDYLAATFTVQIFGRGG